VFTSLGRRGTPETSSFFPCLPCFDRLGRRFSDFVEAFPAYGPCPMPLGKAKRPGLKTSLQLCSEQLHRPQSYRLWPVSFR
jgi:hypothetical protein